MALCYGSPRNDYGLSSSEITPESIGLITRSFPSVIYGKGAGKLKLRLKMKTSESFVLGSVGRMVLRFSNYFSFLPPSRQGTRTLKKGLFLKYSQLVKNKSNTNLTKWKMYDSTRTITFTL